MPINLSIDWGQLLTDPWELAMLVIMGVCAVLFSSWNDIERWYRVQDSRKPKVVRLTKFETTSPRTRTLGWIVGFIVGFPVGFFFICDILLTIPVAAVIAFFVRRTLISRARRSRRDRMDEQTMMLVRVLNQTMLTGESTFRALELSAIAVANPLRAELDYLIANVYTEGTIRAMEKVEAQTDSPYFKQLLRILKNSEKQNLSRTATVGRLTRLYDAFSTMRTLRQSIKAQVAQTRYGQYMVMGLIPLVLMISCFVSPTVMLVVTNSLVGRVLVGLLCIDELIVYFTTSKMLNEIDYDY